MKQYIVTIITENDTTEMTFDTPDGAYGYMRRTIEAYESTYPQTENGFTVIGEYSYEDHNNGICTMKITLTRKEVTTYASPCDC